MIECGREVCGDVDTAAGREWLVTNGIGGYGSGTVAGMLTRRYHGLLIAALNPPLQRTLLLTKLDETVFYGGQPYALFVNHWDDDTTEPEQAYHLERFRLEGTTPVWTYACADALLEKRVWMEPGANTTYIRYDFCRGTELLNFEAKALVNYRDHHANSFAGDWEMDIEPVERGIRVTAFDGATPFVVLSDRAEVTPVHEWYRKFFLREEDHRGLDPIDDNLYAAVFSATLQPGDSLTIVASTETTPSLDAEAAYAERQCHEQQLAAAKLTSAPAPLEQLILAADQFIVQRPLPDDPDGRSIIAGYHWFGDWGRDAMISLPGLTLSTGRFDLARRILRTYSHYVDRGMLPNQLPRPGRTPEYNTADATLWYIEAIRAYHAATGDDDLLQELFPIVQDIVDWHQRGTRYNIHVDDGDGLLYAGQAGVQLTWMDAKIGNWVVTPRIGKPVEINALWYNALRSMADFARRLGESSTAYEEAADQVEASFGRFWNQATGHCYDVLDGPGGSDGSLRPNQLLAVSLPHSPLDAEQQAAVVDVCARRLLTSYGLRSLAPEVPAYTGHYGGEQRKRDAAYHQGTVWAWLIGPFVRAHLRVYRDPTTARSYLEPLLQHLVDHGVGSISEIFEGDPPFRPRGCIAQAWSVAEVLRAWIETAGELAD